MNKIYYLSTCDTCKRILNELQPLDNVQLLEIKTSPLSSSDLDEMKELAGSFEALFSRRARLFRERGLNKKTLTEGDYRALILEHYTFLKRPVMLIKGQIFIGNSAKTTTAAKEILHA